MKNMFKINNNEREVIIDKFNNNIKSDKYEGHYTINDLLNNGGFKFDLNSIPTYDIIKECVIERANSRFGESFIFRDNQLDAIISIILGFFTKENYIMEAPTGSGKSIIALLISDTLNYYFGLKGYILISDLSLLDQYTRDVNAYFPDFKFLKGQDNYYCNENQLTYPFGLCKLQGMTYADIYELPCSETCPYIVARKEAIKADVTLMTYQAWLIQRNYIPMIMHDKGGHPFKQREFTICDEAHKLAEIIQDHFTPIINKDDYNKLAEIVQCAVNEFGPQMSMDCSTNPLYYKEYIDALFSENDNNRLFNNIKDYYKVVTPFRDMCAAIKSLVGKDNAKAPSKTQIKLMAKADWAREYHCKIEDYVTMISELEYGLWLKINQMKILLNLIVWMSVICCVNIFIIMLEINFI